MLEIILPEVPSPPLDFHEVDRQKERKKKKENKLYIYIYKFLKMKRLQGTINDV